MRYEKLLQATASGILYWPLIAIGALAATVHGLQAEQSSIYSNGVPECTVITGEYATNENIETISRILDKDLAAFGGRKIIDMGRRIIISDCETFFAIAPVEPASSEVRSLWVDRFFMILFDKEEYIAPFSGGYLVIGK